MFYVFLNIRRRSTSCRAGGVRSRTRCRQMFYVFHHAVIMAQRVLLWATRSCQRSVQAFMQAVNAFMQAINAFMQAVNAFMQAGNAFMRSCSMSMCSCRLPDLLVWFSTHCTDANRRETVPKQHMPCTMCSNTAVLSCWLAYTTCTAIINFLLNSSIIFCRTLVGSLLLANNVQHSASYISVATYAILMANMHIDSGYLVVVKKDGSD